MIKNVSVQKDSPLNLLSVSLLTEKGLEFKFTKNDPHIIFNSRKYPMIQHQGLYLIKLDGFLTPTEKRVVTASAASHRDKYCTEAYTSTVTEARK